MKIKSLNCPECGASIEIDKSRDVCFCSYCGCKITVDEDKKEINVNINKTTRNIDETEIMKVKSEAKENRKTLLLIFSCIFIFICLLSIPFIKSCVDKQNALEQGKVSVGRYSELEGQDYKSVIAHFEAIGFTNIELIDLNDSGILFWNDGKVVQVSIAGNTRFKKSDYFSKDSKIVITFH